MVPFSRFFWVSLLKRNIRKKGALIVKGLLGNLDKDTVCATLERLGAKPLKELRKKDLLGNR